MMTALIYHKTTSGITEKYCQRVSQRVTGSITHSKIFALQSLQMIINWLSLDYHAIQLPENISFEMSSRSQEKKTFSR